MSDSRPSAPVSHANEAEHRRQLANSINLINQSTPDYRRTDSEISAGVTPVDYRYPPGDARRYGFARQSGAFFVRIPSDFPDLQTAVNVLAPQNRAARIVLLIESGWQLTGGLFVRDGDYSNFLIAAEDALVTLDAAWQGTQSDAEWVGATNARSDHLIFAMNARAPVLGCKIDMGGVGGHGYYLLNNASGFVLPGHVAGVVNAGASGLVIDRGGVVTARETDWSGATANQAPLGDAGHGCFASGGAVMDVQRAICDDVARHGVAGSRGAVVNFNQGKARNAGENGAECRRGVYDLEDADFSGAGNFGINVVLSAIVSAMGTKTTDYGLAAVRLRDGGQVNVTGMTTDTNFPGVPQLADCRVGLSANLRPLYAFNYPTDNGIVYNADAAPPSPLYFYKASNQETDSQNFVNVSGLQFRGEAGETWRFTSQLMCYAGAGTELEVALNHPGVAAVAGRAFWNLSDGTNGMASINAVETPFLAIQNDVQALVHLSFSITFDAPGTFSFRMRRPTGSQAARVAQGSWLEVRRA